MIARVAARFALLCAVILLAGPLVPGTAAFASATDGADAIPLHGCVARQKVGDNAARMFAQPQRFDCSRSEQSFGPGSYWVHFTLPRHIQDDGAPASPLRFVPQWQRTLTIYTRDARGAIFARTLDDGSISHMIRLGAGVVVNLDAHAPPITEVIVRVDGAVNAFGLVVEPQLVGQKGLHDGELLATAIFAAFAGLGIGLLCYNMVLWLTIRERFQLTYCLSLLAMLVYVWASSGAMSVQFPELGNIARLGTSYVMLAFVGGLALQFITDFIEADKLPLWLRATARHIGIVFVIAALGVVLGPDGWRYFWDRVFVVTFIPVPVLVLAMTVIAWRRGSRSIRVLAIAWALPTAMAVLRISNSLGFVPFGPLVQYSLVWAMSAEALLSSLAMSFRLKVVADERDRALADERAARHLASVDPLTGLLNRRALLAQLIDWASPEPLRMFLIDIDRFKLINDRHGHIVGDEVLCDVAQVLAMRADLRGSVARLGGEEFALVGAAHELPAAVALGLLADVRDSVMSDGIRVTVSIGIAEGMVRSQGEWRELYSRADAALYRAKSEGRNRAVHYVGQDSRATIEFLEMDDDYEVTVAG